DLTQIRAAIEHAKVGPQGTALADAVVKAIDVGRSVKGTQKGKRPPAVVVLLSDGGQTAGRVTPRQAAARAKQAGIPVSAVALGTAGAATNECHGIQSCIRVPGPWVVVPAHGTSQYLLTCPRGRSVVAGLDAQVTSRDVRVDFVGRLGAPVQPGATTTRYALFRAVSTSPRAQLFQPLLGCVPTQ